MTMRACTISRFGGPEVIDVSELDVPVPGPGQVRIAVGAAGVNPVDVAIRLGVFGGPCPIGLGWDVAGLIDATGEGSTWRVGDRVMGLATTHVKPLGTYADFVVLAETGIAASPSNLDDRHASSLPLNSLSARQALGLLDIEPGMSILITGSAGAVGGHAVELASHFGLDVTATSSAGDEQYVLGRGATSFIERGASIPEKVFDAVIDCVGGQHAQQALSAVRDGGAFVGMWPGQEPVAERGIRVSALDVQANGEQLAEISKLVELGTVQARVAETLQLTEAVLAHERMSRPGRRGRIVLVP